MATGTKVCRDECNLDLEEIAEAVSDELKKQLNKRII